MKIFVRTIDGLFFSKNPEVCFTNKINLAHIFTCINEEHAKIVVEKTKVFTFKDDLVYQFVEDGVLNEEAEKNEAEKSKKNNDYCFSKNV